MPTLESLKAEHPCIEGVLKVYADAGPNGCSARERAIAALTAKCLENEATIRELEGCLIAEQEHTAQAEAQLSAEQAAHAALVQQHEATIAERDAQIEKMYERLSLVALDLAGARATIHEKAYNAAIARHAQRAANAAKEE